MLDFSGEGQMTIFRQLMGRATGFVVAVILVMASGVAQGQVGLGSISGTVTDATGAAVNGATVTLLNTDRNEVVRTVQTAGTGFYTATSLPLGGYTITVTASGFGDQVFSNVILHVGDALTINSTLKAGATR